MTFSKQWIHFLKQRAVASFQETGVPSLRSLPTDVDHPKDHLFEFERVLDYARGGDTNPEDVLLGRDVAGRRKPREGVEVAKLTN